MNVPFFQINFYSGLLLVGFVQASVSIAILTVRAFREQRRHDALAALILLSSVLYTTQWMLGFGGWYDSHDWRTTLMFYLPWDHLLAFGPLIWLYFQAVTNAAFRFRYRHCWHFLPWAVSLLPLAGAGLYDLLYGWLLLSQPPTGFFGTLGFAREAIGFGPYPWAGVLVPFLVVHLLVYLVRTGLAYRAYRDYLAAEFSSPDGRTLAGLRNVLCVLLFGIVLTLLVAAYQRLTGHVPYVSEWYHHLVLSVMAFAAGILFLEVAGERTRELRFIPAPSVSQPSPDPGPLPAIRALFARTEDRMQRQRDFLEPELRLAELAKRLGTTDKSLSGAINACANQNFNDYVNRWRCAYLVERLQEGGHHERTLLALALDAGFNSKSTFNRAFRKCYGCSPVEVIQQLASGENVAQKMI